ncbi:subclass B1 metallo-beta-lactamase [Hymenobacter sp. NBH84]|uniref:subclass B1 metallo-beta-lactamase n=1 Tax=Hymenobacter sp. NBH84 TaxID=2596915 RepID=UPI001629A0F7|nr:subclass B1 metallo-beta-lactamase [Hymenobacter sp. NBH84]QNE39836.1 subclass B1 metallo-beta-lactamase [Hymenobacter sp. NBH84]
MKFSVALWLLAAVAANPYNQEKSPEAGNVVYHSADLRIVQVSQHTFVHTSFLSTESFGKVACNGLIVKDGNETVVFDTPANEQESKELIAWIKKDLHCQIKAVIPTHFHDDCLGGLKEFERNNILSYAYEKTITYAQQQQSAVPQRSFSKRLALPIGTTKVYAAFWGEGHTKDNIVGYFPDDEVLFGGCLIKELQAGKGNLADANVLAWPTTVQTLKKKYPHVKVVVPGHGNVGDRTLFDYTIQLFQQP